MIITANISATYPAKILFENIMSADRHSVLEELVKQSLLQNFYLAGGTAAALYLGHRWSEDTV